MISKADKQWLEDLIPDYWLGSNGQQKLITTMQIDYAGNCVKKLNRLKQALLNDPEVDKYLPIIELKLKEFYGIERLTL
jgi:hypothetical protein